MMQKAKFPDPSESNVGLLVIRHESGADPGGGDDMNSKILSRIVVW